MGIMFLTLSLFSFILYNNFSQDLYDHLDSLLFFKADGIIDSINTYWDAEKIEALKDGSWNVYTKANNKNFIKIAQKWVENKSSAEKVNDPRLINMIVQIFDAKGKHIISSKELPQIEVLPEQIAKDVINGKLYFNSVIIKTQTNKMLHYRQLTVSGTEGNKVAYIIQISSSLDRLIIEQKSLRTIIFIFLPLMVLLTGVAGSFLASQTLRPVRSMTDTIKKITSQNLSSRIGVPETNDEIAELAHTFNIMLSELDLSFSAQSRFIQDASHELRTPLTIIKGEIEVALKKDRDSSDYQEILVSNLEEINKLTKIIENLLVLAKFDSPEIQVNIERVNLSEVISLVVRNVKILAAAKNIDIKYSYDQDYFISGDRNYLQRLFLNLVENAIKYTSENGQIRVECSKSDDFCKINIKDNGIGISSEDLPNIFNRFYRADKARNTAGFGLGLSIVKSIVELHKGKILVDSELQKGTTFTVLLPLD